MKWKHPGFIGSDEKIGHNLSSLVVPPTMVYTTGPPTACTRLNRLFTCYTFVFWVWFCAARVSVSPPCVLLGVR